MSARLPLAVVLALLAAPLAAEPWREVDKLPGDIAVEIDEDSVFDVIDGDKLVTEATFRRSLTMGIMETWVAVDCARNLAKIRRVRLSNDEGVLADNANPNAQYAAVGEGSAEAIYFKALCGKPAGGPAAQ